MTNICRGSIDIHFQDVVGRMIRSDLFIKTSNASKTESNVPMSTFLQLTVVDLNATTNSETGNAEPKIGTNRSRTTEPNPQVNGSVSGFGPPRASWLGYWRGLEQHQYVFAVQTRTAGRFPGPIANTNSRPLHWANSCQLLPTFTQSPPSLLSIFCLACVYHHFLCLPPPTWHNSFSTSQVCSITSCHHLGIFTQLVSVFHQCKPAWLQ